MCLHDHELKSWVGLFEPIRKGEKKHDFRVLDRDFKVGDICKLREYEPTTKVYTGRYVIVRVTYITSAQHQHCAFSPNALHPGMGVLSIELISEGVGPMSRISIAVLPTPAPRNIEVIMNP